MQSLGQVWIIWPILQQCKAMTWQHLCYKLRLLKKCPLAARYSISSGHFPLQPLIKLEWLQKYRTVNSYTTASWRHILPAGRLFFLHAHSCHACWSSRCWHYCLYYPYCLVYHSSVTWLDHLNMDCHNTPLIKHVRATVTKVSWATQKVTLKINLS